MINVALAGTDSSFKGSVTDVGSSAENGTGTNLTLENGAKWTTTADSTVTTITASADSTIDGTQGSVTTQKFDGDGTFLASASLNEDNQLVTTSLTAETAGTDAHISVKYADITADEVVGREDQLAGAVGIASTNYVEGGDIYDSYTVLRDEEGNVTQSDVKTSGKLESFKGITASSLVQWRNQINHLTKRLGDVRLQQGEIGAWARVYGGEYKWGSDNAVDMTSTTVQVGGDGRLGDWIIGGAFSYTDSSFDINQGSADGDMYSVALYGTRMFDSGAYVDLVGRYGYIKNDISADNMKISTGSNAFSVSAEAGHQFKIAGSGYVEPQIEVAYGFVEGDDDTASNGVRVDQDDYQSLVTRVGFRTGFDFPKDAGMIYAHVSYSYDFLGDADATASKDNVRPAYIGEDLGGGWVTYGIGAQFRIGDSAFAYADLERSTGGDVENPYAFNVGFRWLF